MEPIHENVQDERDVVRAVNRLVISTDNRDWPAVESCFAPKVHFDVTSMAGGEPSRLTPSDVASAWRDGLSHLTAVHHQASNFVVDVEGARARVSCYGTAYHYLPNPTGRNQRTFVGTYDFELVRTDGPWLIEMFRFNLKFIEGNADLEQHVDT